MKVKEAIELCEEYGWVVTEGKWHMVCESSNDKVTFNNDKELLDYAKMLKRERQ